MIDVIILTYNEEKHIKRAIDSVKPFVSKLIIIDSYSTDQTVRIAEHAGATVLQNPFVHQAQQFQWGMDNANITADWILRLDADEIIENDLAQEIKNKLPTLSLEVVGVNLKRKHIFLGRWIKHGGRYPLMMLRIFRRGHGRIEQRWMDEHIVVSGGKSITFEGGFSDWNLNDLTYFTEKHNKYATREAIDVLMKRYNLSDIGESLNTKSSSLQASIKRLIKENIYNRLPFWVGPMFYFLYRYFIQLGFLDGKPGMIYHFLQGFWYRFLVGAKIYEFERELVNLDSKMERLHRLEQMTGHKLNSHS